AVMDASALDQARREFAEASEPAPQAGIMRKRGALPGPRESGDYINARRTNNGPTRRRFTTSDNVQPIPPSVDPLLLLTASDVLDSRPRLKPGATAQTDAERALLALVDGRRTVAELIGEGPLGD